MRIIIYYYLIIILLSAGGWFSLVMGLFYFLMMASWYIGGKALDKYLKEEQTNKLTFGEMQKRKTKDFPVNSFATNFFFFFIVRQRILFGDGLLL